MILRSLKLMNIRSYVSQKVTFPEGTIMFSGDIGSGKSSLLLAIEFALFGIRRAELSGESLLRHGENQGEVELTFKVDEKECIICRRLKRASTAIVQDSGYLIIDGAKEEATARELKARIIGLLGYPSSLITKFKSQIYRFTVYTPQEMMRQILYEDKETRLDTLRQVFGVDKYKRIRENALIFNREIKRSKDVFRGKTESLNEFIERSKELDREVSDLDALIKKEAVKKYAVQLEVEKARKKRDSHEKKIKEQDDIKSRLKVIAARMKEKLSESDRLYEETCKHEKDMAALSEKIAGIRVSGKIDEKPIEDALEKLEGEFSVWMEKRSAHTERISSLKRSIDQISSEVDHLSEMKSFIADKQKRRDVISSKVKNKPKFEEKRVELSEKIAVLRDEMARIDQQLMASLSLREKIKTLKTCPTCRQDVSSSHKEHIDSQEASLSEKLKVQLDAKTDNMKKVRVGLEKIDASLETLRSAEQNLLELDAEIRSQKPLIDGLSKKVDDLNALKKELSELVKISDSFNDEQKISRQSTISELKARLKKAHDNNLLFQDKKNLQERIKDISERMEVLNISKKSSEDILKKLSDEKNILETKVDTGLNEQLSSLKKEEERLLSDLRVIELSQKERETDMRYLSKQSLELSEEINRLKSIAKKAEHIHQTNLWIEEHFVNLMESMERQVMLSIYTEFNSLVQDWFSYLLDDIEIRLDESFTPVIIQNGYETDFSNLSGGEKTSVALSYRLALNRIITDMISHIKTKDLIILDEPTDGFSAEQLDKVRELFDTLDMKQVIIVSHEPKLESFVEHIIRVEKDDMESRIVQ